MIEEAEGMDAYVWADSVQESLVRLLLQDRDFFVRSLPLIKPEYFVLDIHRSIIGKAQDYYESFNELIPQSILLEKFRESLDDPNRMKRVGEKIPPLFEQNEDSRRSREYLFSEVTEFAKIQAMKSAIIQSVDALKTRDFSKIENLMREALLVSPKVDLGLDYFANFDERYRRLLVKQDDEKFSLGFNSVDIELEGGLGKKELGMVFAPAGVGKSLVLVKIGGVNLMQGKKVLYFSLEMDEDVIGARFDASMCMVPYAERITKLPQLKSRAEALRKQCGDNLIIKQYPTGATDLNTLKAYLASLYDFRGWKPDLILLDYADLMLPVHGRDLPNWERQQRVYEEVRGLAIEGNYSILTASQSNRGGREVAIITDKELSDSYGKIRVVDGAWSINQTDEERANNVGRMFVVKHRNGKARYIVYLRFDYARLRILEITKEEYELRMRGEVPINTGEAA